MPTEWTTIQTWTAWNVTWTPTGTATTSNYMWVDTAPIWSSWNATWTQATYTQTHYAVVDTPTVEELTARQEERQAARDRAWDLLLECLDDHGREQVAETQTFCVTGSEGGIFRIDCSRGTSGNVTELVDVDDDLIEVARWCAHPPEGLPAGDVFLAQKLALETDELGFKHVANCHWRRPAGELAA